MIAKYGFFHELSKRIHTTFKKYHLLSFKKNFYHSAKAVPMILETKAHPLKDMYIEGEISFITQTLVIELLVKDMAEAGLPRGLGFLNFLGKND